MPYLPRYDDDEVIEAVHKMRIERGACTLRALCAELGYSPLGLQKRIDALVEAGRLKVSEVPGSLRPADEIVVR